MSVQNILIFFVCITSVIYAEQKYWLPIIPPYDLQSDQRYTLYLPARVHELRDKIKQNGLLKTINFIKNHDHDLESFLFIISVDKTNKLLAYSRQEQFFDKTAAALQKIIFPGSVDQYQQVADIFDQLISTAQKGDTYRHYNWRLRESDPVQYQVAYVHLMVINNKTYVIGACVFVKVVPEYIIFPHRTKTVLSRLKKDGFEQWFNLINEDKDKDLYFEVDTTEQTYRYIAGGGYLELIGKTDKDAQNKIFKSCVSDDCNLTKVWDIFSRVARLGGGYVAYLWHDTPEDPVVLEVSYVLPLTYKKNKLYLCSGYSFPWIKDYIRTELPVAVEKTLKLIEDIGLENAVAAVQKTNTEKLHVFIIEQKYPYVILIGFEKELQGKTSVEATAYVREKNKSFVDYVSLYANMVDFAIFGGGFYAYEYKELGLQEFTKLKIAYIKSVTVVETGEKYLVGATYE